MGTLLNGGGYTMGQAQVARDPTLLAELANDDDRANKRRTQPAGHMQFTTTAMMAQNDLRPFLKEISPHVASKTEQIAKALATQHCSWSNGVQGLSQWCWDSWETFDPRMDALKISVGDRTKLKRALSAYRERNLPPPVRSSVTVKCHRKGEHEAHPLKLVLTPKFMQKSLTDAVLKPYLKAHSKKMGLDDALTLADIEKVDRMSRYAGTWKEIADWNVAVEISLREELEDVKILLKPEDWREDSDYEDDNDPDKGQEALADLD